jgi:hypothetical protein
MKTGKVILGSCSRINCYVPMIRYSLLTLLFTSQVVNACCDEPAIYVPTLKSDNGIVENPDLATRSHLEYAFSGLQACKTKCYPAWDGDGNIVISVETWHKDKECILEATKHAELLVSELHKQELTAPKLDIEIERPTL